MHVDTDSQKSKAFRCGHGLSGHSSLKFTVSQKWADRINWFFVYWYKFRKLKAETMIFLGGHGQKCPNVHETFAVC